MAYLNIEAQQGHLAEQKAMMLAVYEMIRALFWGNTWSCIGESFWCLGRM